MKLASVVVLAASALLIAACSSSPQKQESAEQVAALNKNSAREPAMHASRVFDCKVGNLKLVYDGPGSNYAVGGFSHVYSVKNGTQIRALAYENLEGEYSKLGDQVNQEELEVLFIQQSSTRLSRLQTSPKVGDRCEPGEFGYLESTWKEKVNVKFETVSARVANDMGIKSGEVKTFTCSMSSSTPIECPKSGRYRQGDFR